MLDRLEVWCCTRLRPLSLGDVEGWVLQACSMFSDLSVTLGPWQAVGLAQRLSGQGVSVEEFTFSSGSVGRLASPFICSCGIMRWRYRVTRFVG